MPPFNLKPLDQVSPETIKVCRKFDEKYKSRCIESIVSSQRFHHKFYLNVFKGTEFVSWLVKKKLVRNRKQGEELGKRLVEGRIISHVSKKRDFYDSFHLYKFESL